MKVDIKTSLNPSEVEILIDGKPLKRCVGLEFSMWVGELPRLKLVVYPDEISIDGESLVVGKEPEQIVIKREVPESENTR